MGATYSSFKELTEEAKYEDGYVIEVVSSDGTESEVSYLACDDNYIISFGDGEREKHFSASDPKAMGAFEALCLERGWVKLPTA